MKKTIVISGARGGLGQALTTYYLDEDHFKPGEVDLILLSRSWDSQEEESPGPTYLSNQEFLDLDKKLWLEKTHGRETTFIHGAFARVSEPGPLFSSLETYYQFVAKARDLSFDKFINISSQSVYRPGRTHPALESDPPEPGNFYGMAKSHSEYWLQAYMEGIEKGKTMEWTSIRLASLVGDQVTDRLPDRLVHKGLEEGKIQVFDQGAIFSFMDVRDAAEGLARLVDTEDWDPVYNLGVEESYTIEDLAQEIALQALLQDKKIQVEIEEREGEATNNSLNAGAFYRKTRWEPHWALSEILAERIKEEIHEEG